MVYFVGTRFRSFLPTLIIERREVQQRVFAAGLFSEDPQSCFLVSQVRFFCFEFVAV